MHRVSGSRDEEKNISFILKFCYNDEYFLLELWGKLRLVIRSLRKNLKFQINIK